MAATPGGSDVAVSGSSGSREAASFRREAAAEAKEEEAAAGELESRCSVLDLGNPGGPGLERSAHAEEELRRGHLGTWRALPQRDGASGS